MQSKSAGQSRVFSLKTEKDIRDVFSKGGKHGDQYSVLYCKNNTREHIRAGVFVPKKVFKKAVDRNRAKRIIREVIRQETNGLQSLDIIYILKKCRREELSLKLFRQQIAPLLRKAQ